jgi:lysylphosphatidylglycerol synthetase-like protein (DUF2156 family)
MRILRELVPIFVLQTSYLATAIIGLLLARWTMKGYRDTYRATIFLLLTRIVASLLRGLAAGLIPIALGLFAFVAVGLTAYQWRFRGKGSKALMVVNGDKLIHRTFPS